MIFGDRSSHARRAAWLGCVSFVAVTTAASSVLADVTNVFEDEPAEQPHHGDPERGEVPPRAEAEPGMAQHAPSSSAVAARSYERTAKDVATAPVPGHESGRIGPNAGDSVLRDIAQGALVIPRMTFELVMAPLRAGIWSYERYQLKSRFMRFFFRPGRGNDPSGYTYGLYPSIKVTSIDGTTVGARLVHRDLLGAREHLSFRAGIGGEYREQLDGGLRSGLRFGRNLEISLRGQHERRPDDAFYGVGNVSGAPTAHYRQTMARAAAGMDVHVAESLTIRGTGAITDLEFSRADRDEMPFDTVYPAGMLTGWPRIRNVYSEIELRYDRRGRTTTLDQHATFDTGSLLALYAGPLHQLESGGDYWRYGGEAQAFLPIAVGPRALAARVHLDAVTGSYEDVAFTQLPDLGGKRYLRGYARDRFRDRVSAFGSLEYQWDLARMLMASVFVDVGRVYPELADISANDLRVGYGVTLQLHDNRAYIADIAIATSKDGGVFAYFSFDPVFETEQRIEVK